MFGVLADNADYAVPLNYLALIADWFNAGPNFHRVTPLTIRQTAGFTQTPVPFAPNGVS
jgi:hypothetical protein